MRHASYRALTISAAAAMAFAFAPLHVAQAAKEKVLYSFTGGKDGAGPMSSLLMDAKGNLFGTTYGGGASNAGVVFRLTPKGKLIVLYSFKNSGDGSGPYAGLIMDAKSNLYGTTAYAGAYGDGAVFKLTPTGHETALYSFDGGDSGGNPFAGLIMGKGRDLYGATANGGAYGQGAVFKLTHQGEETVLHSFAHGNPVASLLMDKDGNLYGTTQFGGDPKRGTAFRLAPDGTETILHTFTGGADGSFPEGNLIMDKKGNLYGTTYNGDDVRGTVFRLAPDGTLTVLHSFSGGSDGADPAAGLIVDGTGNFYGTTVFGGTHDAGVVFKLTPKGKESVLYSFGGGSDGTYPYAGLIMDETGKLYGTTSDGGANKHYGTVFEITP
jgi:uncharacterized repeat protein (TIGR03803 family)